MKKTIISQFIDIYKEEIAKSNGTNKLLLYSMLVNIPSPLVFIPYVTQALTIFLVLIFLKRIVDLNNGSVFLYSTIGITILFQIVWIPFISQLISITLLGVIFALNRKTSHS